MHSKDNESSLTVENPDYYSLLIALGVPENLLIPEELDLALLYKRLRFVMSGFNSITDLECRESWQMQAPGQDHECLAINPIM